jgi:heme-degrading monooxygenase HmoA
MVGEYIRYEIAEGQSVALEAAYRQAQDALDASKHCLSYELSRGVEEPTNYILRIEWDSLEGHEQGFRSSPEFGSFLQSVRPFFDDIREMKHYQATDVSSDR